MCFKKLSEKYIKKKMKWYDISLIKGSTLFATLFLVTAWPGFRDFVLSVSWQIWLILMIITALGPMMRYFSK